MTKVLKQTLTFINLKVLHFYKNLPKAKNIIFMTTISYISNKMIKYLGSELLV